jgi:hypothetical protein
MAVLVNDNTKGICQGFTGSQSTLRSQSTIAAKTISTAVKG